MGSYKDELLGVLMSNASEEVEREDIPLYLYTEDDLIRLRDLIIEKFRIGYEECEICHKDKPAILTFEVGHICEECYEKKYCEKHQW